MNLVRWFRKKIKDGRGLTWRSFDTLRKKSTLLNEIQECIKINMATENWSTLALVPCFLDTVFRGIV